MSISNEDKVSVVFKPRSAVSTSGEKDKAVLKSLLGDMDSIDREVIRQKTMFASNTGAGKFIGRTSSAIYKRLHKPKVQRALGLIEDKQDEEILETKKFIRQKVTKALRVMDEGMDIRNDKEQPTALAITCARDFLERDPDTMVKKDAPLAVLTPEGVKEMAGVIQEIEKIKELNDGKAIRESKEISDENAGTC